MKKFYRVERIMNGVLKGIYCGSRNEPEDHPLRKILNLYCNKSPRHPGPYSDQKLCAEFIDKESKATDYHFGFHTKTQLLRWFPAHVLEKLIEAGAIIVEISFDAEDIVRGGSQSLVANSKFLTVRAIDSRVKILTLDDILPKTRVHSVA